MTKIKLRGRKGFKVNKVNERKSGPGTGRVREKIGNLMSEEWKREVKG